MNKVILLFSITALFCNIFIRDAQILLVVLIKKKSSPRNKILIVEAITLIINKDQTFFFSF